MIRTARFRNFKALRNVTVPLDRFTVFVGPNASGKTTILQGLHHLSLLAFARPSRLFQGVSDPNVLRSAGAEGGVEVALDGEWDGRPGNLKVKLSPSGTTVPAGGDWACDISGQWGNDSFGRIESI